MKQLDGDTFVKAKLAQPARFILAQTIPID